MTRGELSAATALLASVATLLVIGSGPSSAAPPEYDTFDKVTVNALDAGGLEIPYAGPAHQWNVDVGSTAGFTVQAGESEAANNVNGCTKEGGGGFDYAGKTAWLRFNPAVDGQIYVRAFTPGYDSILAVREATEATFGFTQLTDLPGHDVDCSNTTAGNGEESVGYCATPNPGCHRMPVLAQYVYFIQVGGKCSGGPETCSDPGVPGGPTSLRLDFLPDDEDGDGVPDTLDDCLGTSGGTRVNSHGCPDQDGDEIADTEDDCDTLPGVPAPSPFNGCPAGPTPPDPGAGPYVVVTNLAGGLDATNDIAVRLALNWPQGAQTVEISNNDFMSVTRRLDTPGSSVQSWSLRPLSPGEGGGSATRTVSVTYRGPGIPDTYRTGSITLDTTPPSVPGDIVVPAAKGWYAGLDMRDAHGTGISRVTLFDKAGKRLAQKVVCTSARACPQKRIERLVTRGRPVLAVVEDAAGNVLKRRLTYKASCQPPAFQVARVNASGMDCFHDKEIIDGRAKRTHDFAGIGAKLKKVAPNSWRVTAPAY